MKVVKTIAGMKKARHRLRGSVGFVPTMGYLHEGHLELARRSRDENRYTVVSIFVNPSQFGPKDDFAKYPRDTERDLAMLKEEKVNIVFMPGAEEMYPPRYSTWVDVEKVSERLEGATRPGHFRGVSTVVSKLFNIVEPTRAYFGQKDAQQLVVIKKMVTDLNMNLEVIAVPTVREPDGLAMSSRNVYLNPREKEAALILAKSLSLARKLWGKGERNADVIRREMISLIETEHLSAIDYVSVADTETLEELAKIDRPAVISMAVRIGKTRLIDNILLAS
ncbi:MAG TPA: pantoate--beta-alanine ligase [Dehalococcoidia bacterium]|nr:pantoate--beta-alanine ligase [Dehalococcoidia bacterium]